MTDADVSWVCCPAGIVDNRLRLSVVVAPQLRQDGNLSDFPALVDWPRELDAVQWRIELDEERTFDAVRVGPGPDPVLWRSVFPATTPVLTFGSGRERSRAPVLTYPAKDVAEVVRRRWSTAATTVADHQVQPAAMLRPDFDLRPLEDFRAGLTAGLDVARRRLAELAGDDPGFVAVEAAHAAGATSVGRAYAMQQPLPETVSDDATEGVDFHRIVTLLGDHPALLRRLGLIIDLALLAPELPTEARRVRISPTSNLPSGVVHRRPRTAAVVQHPSVFRARSDDSTVELGVWPVAGPDWSLESLDVDTAVRKAVALASAPDFPIGENSTPPALRNDGIALVHRGRAETLIHTVTRSRRGRTALAVAPGSPEPPDLVAENLLRGYRVDVWDDATEAFHSLHARRVEYEVDGLGPVPGNPVQDEGTLQDSLTGDAALLIHERQVTWRGWSLSAPRPGDPRHLAAPGSIPPEFAALHTHITTRAQPGTLPRLRFGRTYRMRLRTVDVAGTSVPVARAPDVATSRLLFLRYEPVGAPVVAPVGVTETFGPGETLHRLVVRAAVPDADGSLVLGEEPPAAERLLLPPRGSVSLAEQHGMFDDAIGSPDPAARTVARTLLTREHAELTLPVGEFVPYLPDPLASEVVFLGLPGVPDGEPFAVRFEEGSTWADVRPIRLRLRGVPLELLAVPGPVPPRFDPVTRTLDVFLEEGRRHLVRMSSLLRDPDLMALLTDIRKQLSTEEADRVEARVRAGTHPMFTPYVGLELVHAQHAPGRVDFHTDLVALRDVGEPSVGLRTTLAVDARTTDAVALHARWTEHVDDDGTGRPGQVVRTEQVLSTRLPPDAEHALPPSQEQFVDRHLLDLDTAAQGLPRHQLPDAGHRVVTYSPVATARFADCFPDGVASTSSGSPRVVRLPNAAVPPPPVVHSVIPSLQVQPVEVERSDDAFGSAIALGGAPDDLPPEPGWARTTQNRRGGGLRVYLERPWFVSGADESLGVVVVGPALSSGPVPGAADNVWAFDTENRLPQWFSQMGQDPIRRTAGVMGLSREMFQNATQERALPALRDALAAGVVMPATVLGHVPQFEEASGLWFVDIQVSGDFHYLPFFRLAVGRFQPNSLSDDVCLSKVSTIDLIQPVPNRRLTILRHAEDAEITVTVWGATYQESDPDIAARMTARLFVAEAGAAATGGLAAEDLRWQAVEQADEVTLPRDPVLSLWSAKLTVPTLQPGQALRLLVVERDQMHSPTDDTGAGSTRIVYVGAIDV